MPETRDRLIDAAIAELSAKGEQGLRVTSVAEAAGVTEPAVHYFFGNREGLVTAALAEQFSRIIKEINVPFRDAALECGSKRQFAQLCEATLRAAYDPSRATVRAERTRILGAATSRPELAEQIVAAQSESLLPLIEGLRFGQDQGWVTPALDLEAFGYWTIGQVSGRVMAELAQSPEELEAWSVISIAASLSVLGLA